MTRHPKSREKKTKKRNRPKAGSTKPTACNTMAQSECQLRMVLDCQFQHLMTYKDLLGCAHQIRYVFACNRRLQNPTQLFLTNLELSIESILARSNVYNWDIHLKKENLLTVFDVPRSSIVYLTPDSPNVLDQLDKDKVYVIGCIVDRNLFKKVSLRYAEEHGLSHARLPIQENVPKLKKYVLTIDQVFGMLATFIETDQWSEAVRRHVPMRLVNHRN
ncbi:hypothetical protein ACOME3_003736 [Neoechinorhynchus agilis]